MIYFLLDNIYNTDLVTNGIYFRYQELINEILVKKKKNITLITRYIPNIKYPESTYFNMMFINFYPVPFSEVYIPLPTIQDINLLLIKLKKKSTLITLIEYCTIIYFIPKIQQNNNIKLILGYHTRLDVYAYGYYKMFIPAYLLYEFLWYNLKPKIILASGYATKNILKNKFDSDIKVWYQMNSHFINLNPIYPKFNANKQITLIYVGRIALEKNIYDLIKILEMYNKNYSKAILVIIGDGPELKNIKKMSQSCKHQIIIRGLVPNNQLICEYTKYTNPFYVFTSVSETLGKSVIEANLCMIPTISAISEETPYLYKDDYNGFTYKTLEECCYKINYFCNKTNKDKKNLLKKSRKHFVKLFKNSTKKIINYL